MTAILGVTALLICGYAQAVMISDTFDDGTLDSAWVGDTSYYAESGGKLNSVERDGDQFIVQPVSQSGAFTTSVDFALNSVVSGEEDWAGLLIAASADGSGNIVYTDGTYPDGYYFRVRTENGRVTFGHNGTAAFVATGTGTDLGALSTGVNYQAVITSDTAGTFTGQLINLDTMTTLVTLSFTDTAPLYSGDYAGIYSRKMETGDVAYDNYLFEYSCDTVIILAQPQDVAVDEDEEAVFSVEAAGPPNCDDTGLTFQWYRDGDATPLTSDAKYTVSGKTLTVHNVQSQDTGGYYCVVSDGVDPVSSDIAQLRVQGILAHWTLDAVNGQPDATDITGNGHDGQLSGDPEVIAGVINEGLAFDANDLILPGYFQLQTEMTLSAWIHTNAWGVWSILEWDDPSTGEIRTFRLEDGILEYGEFDRIEWYNVEYENVRLNDSQWHHIAVTRDAQDMAKLYVDGRVVAEASLAESQYDPSSDITMANLKETPELLFDAVLYLDEVRVYDYALTANQVADLFVEVNGYACAESPMPGDIDGDCRVDIVDLAELGMRWLDCQRYPECIGQMP